LNLTEMRFHKRRELRARGVEIVHAEKDESGNGWVHFCAPDGNIYEFTQDPGVSRPE
jgi:hypothetical protein